MFSYLLYTVNLFVVVVISIVLGLYSFGVILLVLYIDKLFQLWFNQLGTKALKRNIAEDVVF